MNALATISYEDRLKASYKAVQARIAAAARSVPQIQEKRPVELLSPPEPDEDQDPAWMEDDIHFDAHVQKWRTWKVTKSSRVREYIEVQCQLLGYASGEVRKAGRAKEIVPIRDRLIYEIKTKVNPTISWFELGRLFHRDHSSMVTAYYRGAALAGDRQMAEVVESRRVRSKLWHQRVRAK